MRSLICVPAVDFYFAVIVALGCKSAHLPPPQNLSYVWTDDFHIQVTWQKPESPEGCELRYRYKESTEPYMCRKTSGEGSGGPVHESCLTTETIGPAGLRYTVTAECGSVESEPAAVAIPPVVQMVKDFKCILYSSDAMNCTFTAANHTSDLEVSYRSCNEPQLTTSACRRLPGVGPRMGCHLANISSDEYVCVVIEGTSRGKRVNNTFTRNPMTNIIMPAPKLKITENGDYLRLKWNAPTGPAQHCWKYIVYYSMCGDNKTIEESIREVHKDLPYNKRCQYKVQVKGFIADHCNKGESDISDVVIYGENAAWDPSIVVVLTVIPALLSACVILACYFLRRKQKVIFSNVPDPSILLKEMMISSHQPEKASQRLYTPAREKMESCLITPLTERQQPGLPRRAH